jgi:hypothetical protein
VRQRLRGLLGNLLPTLLKPRNGGAWTAEDRARLDRGLRRLARASPLLLVFLLPGGLILAPALAWGLDLRRRRRLPAQQPAGGPAAS